MTAIKTENLTKIYRKRHLGKLYTTLGIKNLNLEIRKGEIFGLLGLNGSGKTTTIKLILGLLFPTAGKIQVFDQTMPDRKILSKIGYLPEIPYFQKFLTGREILKFYKQLGDTGKDNLSDIIETVGLTPHVDKRISEFSKGMLQRLGLAQTLLSDPPLLIFDELVSGLDPLGIREMRSFVMSLKSKGKTIFFSSHIISEAEKICDRVGILHQGGLKTIVEKNEWKSVDGKLEEIFIDQVT